MIFCGGIGGTLKGHFSSDSLGEYILFVDAGASPTIRIERAGQTDIYISYKEADKTRSLFNALRAAP